MPISARATTYTFGTSGNDVITAQYLFGDLIDGLAGNDTIYGLNGSDTLKGGAGRDILYGYGGYDTLDGGNDNDQLFGGDGDDILQPGRGNDLVDGGTGIDTVDYSVGGLTSGVSVDLRITTQQYTRGGGYDTIIDVENVIGTNYSDTINGSAANNVIKGGAGNDKLYGNDGHDQLHDGTGSDSLYGGTGNDWFYLDMSTTSSDLVDGGPDGLDGVQFVNATAGVTLNLNLTTQQLTASNRDTLMSIEQVAGTNFDDTIIGNASNNYIHGNLGNDTLYGGDGNDSLFAGLFSERGATNYVDGGNGTDVITDSNGTDTLIGGAGDDYFRLDEGRNTIAGGAGADKFIFTGYELDATLVDTITDFDSSDTIYLGSAMTYVGDAEFTQTFQPQFRMIDTGNGILIELDTDGNGPLDVDFRILVQGSAPVWNIDPALSDIQFGFVAVPGYGL